MDLIFASFSWTILSLDSGLGLHFIRDGHVMSNSYQASEAEEAESFQVDPVGLGT
jgi:hypothetical protein